MIKNKSFKSSEVKSKLIFALQQQCSRDHSPSQVCKNVNIVLEVLIFIQYKYKVHFKIKLFHNVLFRCKQIIIYSTNISFNYNVQCKPIVHFGNIQTLTKLTKRNQEIYACWINCFTVYRFVYISLVRTSLSLTFQDIFFVSANAK